LCHSLLNSPKISGN